MTVRTIRTIARTSPLPDSPILRPFPSEAIPSLDPFVFLDTGAPARMGDRELVVAPHPHRGVVPISLAFSASVTHRDSMGVEHHLESGGIQWLVSGRGALHEERIRGGEGSIFHMAQLWLNLPARLKMIEPEHHAVPAESIPVVEAPGASVRLFAGEFAGERSPVELPVPVFIAHVTLAPGASLELPARADWTAGVVCVEGSLDTPEASLDVGDAVVFEADGDTLVVGSEAGGQALVLVGEPLGEPVAMGGGFVMNTEAEIAQAYDDLRAGRMGRLDASS